MRIQLFSPSLSPFFHLCFSEVYLNLWADRAVDRMSVSPSLCFSSTYREPLRIGGHSHASLPCPFHPMIAPMCHWKGLTSPPPHPDSSAPVVFREIDRPGLRTLRPFHPFSFFRPLEELSSRSWIEFQPLRRPSESFFSFHSPFFSSPIPP